MSLPSLPRASPSPPAASGISVDVPMPRLITCRTLLNSFATYRSWPLGENAMSWGLPPNVKVRVTAVARRDVQELAPRVHDDVMRRRRKRNRSQRVLGRDIDLEEHIDVRGDEQGAAIGRQRERKRV